MMRINGKASVLGVFMSSVSQNRQIQRVSQTGTLIGVSHRRKTRNIFHHIIHSQRLQNPPISRGSRKSRITSNRKSHNKQRKSGIIKFKCCSYKSTVGGTGVWDYGGSGRRFGGRWIHDVFNLKKDMMRKSSEARVRRIICKRLFLLVWKLRGLIVRLGFRTICAKMLSLP